MSLQVYLLSNSSLSIRHTSTPQNAEKDSARIILEHWIFSRVCFAKTPLKKNCYLPQEVGCKKTKNFCFISPELCGKDICSANTEALGRTF